MIDTSTIQHTTARFVGTTDLRPDNTSTNSAVSWRGAESIAMLDLPPASAEARPKLRESDVSISEKDFKARSDIKNAMGLEALLSMLMGMLLKLELASSKTINATSSRETALAKAQADSRRSAGKLAMIGGITKAASMSVLNLGGLGLSLKGINKHLVSTHANAVRNQEASSYLTGSRAMLNSTLSHPANGQSLFQKTAHDLSSLHYGRNQAVSSSIQFASTSAGAVIDGSNTNGIAGLDADRDISAGDASVANRNTDIQIKERNRQEGLREQMFSTLKNTIQAQLDVMSHVANATRI